MAGNEEQQKDNADSLIADIQKKITEAFDIFDHESNKTVDVSRFIDCINNKFSSQPVPGNQEEIGTIIRSLGCCMSEAELHDMLAEIEEEEPTGYIRFEKFLPMMTKVLMERRNLFLMTNTSPSIIFKTITRYKPAPEDQLLKAFQVLDQDGKGYLNPEELTKYMLEEGEPFLQEELEEMLSAAVDPDKRVILYKDYVSTMSVEDV